MRLAIILWCLAFAAQFSYSYVCPSGSGLELNALQSGKYKAVSSPRAYSTDAMQLDFTTQKAGELKTLLGANLYKVTNLKVEGPINNDDYNTMWDASYNGVLKEIDLGNAVPESAILPVGAFYHSEQVDNDAGVVYIIQLEKIVLPPSITEIGDLAFASVTKLKEIKLPEQLRKIGNGAFFDCIRLCADPFVFPENLEEIGDQAFMNCRNLTGEIVLPNAIKRIEKGAFYSCKIEKINFPAGLEYIGMFAFHFCNLKEVYLPAGCKFDPLGCQFESNFQLVSVHLPDDCAEIPEQMFMNCVQLTSLDIPSAKTIGPKAFSSCEKLKEINLPEGLESIDNGAFSHCASLQEILFPSTLKTIGVTSFMACTNVKTITCRAMVPPGFTQDSSAPGRQPFSDMSVNTAVFIPFNTKAAYSEAYGWNHFMKFIEDQPGASVTDVIAGDENADNSIYDLTGRKVIRPVEGQIYIRSGKKVIFRH